MSQTAIPRILMRGVITKGPFPRSHHLPADPAQRDAVLPSGEMLIPSSIWNGRSGRAAQRELALLR